MIDLLQKALVTKGSVRVDIFAALEGETPIKLGTAEARSLPEMREAIAVLFEEVAKMVRGWGEA